MGNSRTRLKMLAAALAGFALAGTLIVAPSPAPASAVTGSEFSAGNIISDALFYDGQAMTKNEIQAFLNSKIGTCINGRCLNVLTAPVSSRAKDVSQTTGNLICEAFTGGTLSAADIIYRAQVACGISAKVILVTLQKEQGLVSSRAPGEAALDRAMGMACPDTAPCAEYALGFGNQVYLGARQLKAYKAAAFAKQPGVHQIQYHPNTSCGSSSVNIVNYATAALYNYTPYRPNAAALANLGGVGDSCSSYGNRNFWWYYSNWFGSSLVPEVTATDHLSHILARTPDGKLSIFQPNSRGQIASELNISSGWETYESLIPAGDVDGDGHRDILGRDSDGALWLHATDGLTGIQSGTLLAGDWTQYVSIFSVGRFDAGSAVDLMAISADGRLWLFPGNGRGTFGPARLIGNGWGVLDQVFSPGDFDGDGKADVVGRDSLGQLRLYRGNGAGGWLGSKIIGNGWLSMRAVFGAGDYTFDSRADIFAQDAAGRLWVYPGNGKGGWLAKRLVPGDWTSFDLLVGPGPVAGAAYFAQPGLGDFNADSAGDVAARTASGDVVLYPTTGAGRWKVPVKTGSNLADVTAVLAAGDLAGDGQPDLLARTAEGTLVRIPISTAGELGERAEIGHGWNIMKSILAAGDLDGDGYHDILAIDDTGTMWAYLGKADGTFGVKSQVGVGWGAMTAVFNVGDFDGDAITDLLARDASGRLLLYSGTGTASWKAPRVVGYGWNIATAFVAPGDFNGDGTSDVLARMADGSLRLYPTTGTGGWGKPAVVGVGWGSMSWIG
ncbi:FG-GAP repeat domain-containing protein [Rhodoglobus sp.]